MKPVFYNTNKEEEIMRIFLKDWYSLKEASKIYYPALQEDQRSHRTVALFFSQFKKNGWVESKSIQRDHTRTRNGKEHVYKDRSIRFRLNFGFYFDSKNISIRHYTGWKDTDYTLAFKIKNKQQYDSIGGLYSEADFINTFLSQPSVVEKLLNSNRKLTDEIDRLLLYLFTFSNTFQGKPITFEKNKLSEFLELSSIRFNKLSWEGLKKECLIRANKIDKQLDSYERFEAMVWLFSYFMSYCWAGSASRKRWHEFSDLLKEYDEISLYPTIYGWKTTKKRSTRKN